MEITETTHTRRATPFRRPEPDALGRGEPPRALARRTAPEQRALGLGWLSIGLGLAELLAPRQVARLIGADHEDTTTRMTLMAFGARELTCGIGLLSEKRPEVWAWARVVGDVLDVATLGYAWSKNPPESERTWSIAGSLLAIGALDLQTAIAVRKDQRVSVFPGVHVQQSVSVNLPPQEVYAFFRDLENLPRIMSHLESVEQRDRHSRWRARGPLGVHIEWDAQITEDRPGQSIAWRSLPGADVSNQGRVEFRPGPAGAGTEVRVELAYDPPLGTLGAGVAKLFGEEPSQQISADLRRLKQVLETGEVLHSDASIHSGMHPAQPSPRARTAVAGAALDSLHAHDKERS